MIKNNSKFNLFLFLIKFYQKYLSILFGYGCCRYYPTCSEYAFVSFQHNNVFVATIKSVIRILKCNPIFSIGFDYPNMQYKPSKYKNILDIYSKNKKIKFFLVPINEKKNKFYIIKKI